jgi:hypothetical protein
MITRLEQDQGIEVSAELVTVGGMDAIQVTILVIGPPNIGQIGVVGLVTGEPIFTCTKHHISNEVEFYSECMWNLGVRWEEPPPGQIDILESLSAVES